MAQKKAHEVDAWLARPDPRVRLVLLYGPDRGLVSERARGFAAKAGVPLDDPFSVVKLDASDPDQAQRLLEETQTVAMFARQRLVWLRNASTQKDLADRVEALVSEPPPDVIVVIEAGELKKNAPLRTIVEAGSYSIALPCYADEGRGVDSLIDEELGQAGLSISLEARQALRQILGGDRLASRGELQKLVLFSRGRGSVGIQEVRESVGDVAALSSDDVVDALLAGDASGLDRSLMRLAAAGAAPAVLLGAVMRQFQALQLMRRAMEEGGRTAQAAVAAARPPVFFTRRKLVEAALQRWPAEALVRALERLQSAVLEGRRRPELLAPISRQALLSLALEGARRMRSAGR